MDKVNDILQYPICLDRFKEPKVLPCQHTFCLTCLENCLENCLDADRIYVSSIKCPTCRTSHTLPPDGMERLPSNHTIVQLLDIPLSGNCFVKPLHQLETSLKRMNIEREKTQLARDLKQRSSDADSSNRSRQQLCGIIVDHSPRLMPGPMSLFGPGIGVGIHRSRVGSLFDDHELTFVTDDTCFLPF